MKVGGRIVSVSMGDRSFPVAEPAVLPFDAEGSERTRRLTSIVRSFTVPASAVLAAMNPGFCEAFTRHIERQTREAYDRAVARQLGVPWQAITTLSMTDEPVRLSRRQTKREQVRGALYRRHMQRARAAKRAQLLRWGTNEGTGDT